MSGRVTVTLRCYGDLGELLAPGHRQRDLVRAFDVGPSAKDAVEGVGVPHTEVELLVLDGRPVGFEHRLADGERLAAYPPFTTPELPVALRLRAAPAAPARFVADIHLLALARRLRLLGFDTLAGPALVDDAALARTAVEGQRILLSRDRGLLKRATIVHGALVRSPVPQEQAVEVVRRFDLAGQLRPFTRCPACNGELRAASVAELAGRLPPRTREAFAAFSQCATCGRAYWEGAHHERLVAAVEDVRRRGARGRGQEAPDGHVTSTG